MASSPGILNTLLKEGWIIRINREVLLCMFAGMVLPGRTTVPTHFRVVLKATI